MLRKLFNIFLIIGFAATSVFVDDFSNARAELNLGQTKRPIVAELFTSHGCSSCPPADKVLGELATEHGSDVLALSFHVDYWNYIGWNDPFSSSEFSNRQRLYAREMHRSGVYTPQMVVDGYLQTVGSGKGNVFALIKQASEQAAYVPIDIEEGSDNIIMIALPEDKSGNFKDSYIVLVGFDSKHETNITRGENSGRKLVNYNVVRDFKIIGSWNGEAQKIAINKTQTDRFAVLLQEKPLGRIIGVAYVKYSI